MSFTHRCARPGCSGAVAAWLTYDYAGQRVWLDDVASSDGDKWPLCATHADAALKVPNGWVCYDERVPVVAHGFSAVAS